jgi:hypothetical protein
MKALNILKANLGVLGGAVSGVILATCIYNLGYYRAKLEKPRSNNLAVHSVFEELNLETVPEAMFNPDLEPFLHISSDVQDSSGETLNRIGIDLQRSKQNPDLHEVIICDSVNKNCFHTFFNQKEEQEKYQDSIIRDQFLVN